MKYSTPPRLSRKQATADLASADSRKRVDALLSLALYDSDWRWVQDQCLRLLADPEEDVVATAILGLGHLARLHQRLDLERVLPPLITLQADQRFSGRVSDAFADIRMFVSDSKGRINRGEEEPQNTAALIQILRDRSARIDERDDAAIDLGRSDDDGALAALLEMGAQSDDDDIVLGSIGESIAHIAIRTGKFESSWLARLSPLAVDELVGSLRALRPQLLGEGTSDHNPGPGS